MHPKTRNMFLIMCILLLILTLSCKKQAAQITEESNTLPKKTLGELQTEACNAADSAGTCSSRLIEVGIVSPEECCNILGKCC